MKNKDDTSTVLYVPINQTGTYTLLTHSTLFGGSSTTEPITLAAKFTNISSEMNLNVEQPDIMDVKSIPSYSEDNSTKILETKTISKEIVNSTDDFPFGTGIVIGIVIGIMIGIVFIFMIKQKLPR